MLSKLKNWEEFEGGLEKKEGKRGKKKNTKRVIKHFKIPLGSLNDRKKIHKNREEF